MTEDTWIVFEGLLRASWQTSVLVGLVLGIQALCGRRLSPGWRHGLWFLVLVRLALPVLPESRFSLYNLSYVTPVRHQANAGVSAPGTGQTAPRTELGQGTLPPESRRGLVNALSPRDGELAQPVRSLSREGDAPARPQPNRPELTRSKASELVKVDHDRILQRRLLLLWGWVAGVLLLGTRFAWQNLRFALRLRRGWLATGPIVATLRACAREMDVRRVPVLLETDAVMSPALYGLLSPRLLLPEGMAQKYSLAELRFVFMHELGHVQRWDMLVNCVLALFQTVHWFNPVLWYGFSRMRADRELACDALVLASAGEGEIQAYGETIIKILSGLGRPATLPALVGILEDKRQMKQRISMISQFQKRRPWSWLPVALLAALAAATLTDAQRNGGAEQGARDANASLTPSEQAVAPAGLAAVQATEVMTKVLVHDARILIELGKLDEAELKLNQALRQAPEDRNALYYSNLIAEARQAPRKQPVEVLPLTGGVSPTVPVTAPAPSVRTNTVRTEQAKLLGQELIRARLNKIVLEEVAYDGLPLREVVRDLNQLARLGDPEKRGINFILNYGTTPAEFSGQLGDVLVRLRLRKVSLAEVVEAVSKATEAPIKYSIEEYAVVFSLGARETPTLFTRTFKVDSTTFLRELDHVLETQGQTNSALSIGAKIRSLFESAGMHLPRAIGAGESSGAPGSSTQAGAGKAVFFSDRTGLLLVRATMNELDYVEKIVQILNTPPPQLSVQTKLIEFSRQDQDRLGFDWFMGNGRSKPVTREAKLPGVSANQADQNDPARPSGTGVFPATEPPKSDAHPQATVMGILTDPQFRVLRRALEQRSSARTLAAPALTTLSGRTARMEVPTLGFALDLLPLVMADGTSVQVDVDMTMRAQEIPHSPADDSSGNHRAAQKRDPLRVRTSAIIWDGQTMVLGPFPSESAPAEAGPGDKPGEERSLFFFVTPTIVDPAGNRVHTPR